jgi:hypothetical protein
VIAVSVTVDEGIAAGAIASAPAAANTGCDSAAEVMAASVPDDPPPQAARVRDKISNDG